MVEKRNVRDSVALYSSGQENSPNAGVFERSRKAARLQTSIIATISNGVSPNTMKSRYIGEDQKSVRSQARSLTISTRQKPASVVKVALKGNFGNASPAPQTS
jgi:hypothetical protein